VMSINKKEIAQLRLLIPIEMLEELDTIASSRATTRLSIIRMFLRNSIDSELDQLEIHFQEMTRRDKTHRRLQQHLFDKER
jgi:hypothetical protein